MPIIETVGGDLTGYVQTNLISMSDGHTLFDLETFYKGIRPAVNIGLSVSRVGKQTQTKLQKQVASDLRTMLAQYGEAKNFVRFGAELTEKTKLLFLRGTLFEELIKQDLKTHLKTEEQLMVMLSLLGGYFDEVPAKDIVGLRNAMLEVFRKPDYDQLRQALKDSADEAARKPLMDAYYAALPPRPKKEEGKAAAAAGRAGSEARSTEKATGAAEESKPPASSAASQGEQTSKPVAEEAKPAPAEGGEAKAAEGAKPVEKK
jgi:hypothetical protein